ncbi:MAG: hypothetical protein WA210_18170 [Burkholderiaceae bacterium]
MTDTTIPDSDLLAIYRCRDFGRVEVGRILTEKLPTVHATHALISECLALILGCNIEAARTVTTEFLTQLFQQVANRVATEDPKSDANNIVAFKGSADAPAN